MTTALKLQTTLATACVGAVMLLVPCVLQLGSRQAVALILEPPSIPDEDSSSDNRGLTSIGTMQASVMTQTDRLAMVCDRVPRNTLDCRTVPPTWSQYYQQHWARLTQKAGGRRRRFTSNWNTGSDWFGWNNDPWWSSSWNHPASPKPQQSSSGSSGSAFICPAQANQSFVYELSSDNTNYPASAIATELGLNLAFFQFLMQEVVLTNTPPSLTMDEFLQTANRTCPFTERRLWEYRSLNRGSKCWVLANFGEQVLYRRCNTTKCQNCTDPMMKSRFSGSHSSFWSWSSSRGSSPGPSPRPQSSLNQKRCLVDYRRVSFWAYCPTLPAGMRIVRDRIIIPLTCSCRTVKCPPVGH